MAAMSITQAPAAAHETTAIFGSHVLARREGKQTVLADHCVVLEGNRIAAVTPSRLAQADRVYDRPGRFCCLAL